MSTRKRKQQGLVILVLALFVALIAGSAGFATGYGADAAKRSALSKQVEELKASLGGTGVSAGENDALKKENEELRTKVASLEEEVAALKEENAVKTSPETNNNVQDNVLDPIETGGSNNTENQDNAPTARVSIVDRITKYVILTIVAILVIMGISMFFFGKRADYDDDDEDDEEDVRAKIKEAPGVKKEAAEPEKAPEADIFGDDDLKAEYERYASSEKPEKVPGETAEIPDLPAEPEKTEESPRSASVPDTLEELMAQSPSAHNGDE